MKIAEFTGKSFQIPYVTTPYQSRREGFSTPLSSKMLNSIPWMFPIYNSCTELQPRFVHSILDALVMLETLFSNFIFLFLYPWLTYGILPTYLGNLLPSVIPTPHSKSLPSKNNPLNKTYTSFVSKISSWYLAAMKSILFSLNCLLSNPYK